MLTSITPLGEQGRGNKWGTTATWLVLGHLIGGAALGLVLIGAEALISLLDLRPDAATATTILAATVVCCAAYDVSGRRLPGRRQVDERWLNSYRGWVYGSGFGVQLGFGFVTVVNTALFVAVCVAGALLGGRDALTVGAFYGATRGIVVCINGRLRSTSSLRRMHRRLDRLERPVRWAAALAAGAVAVGAVVA